MIRRSLRPSRRCAKEYDKWIGMTSRQMNLPQDREETGDGGTGGQGDIKNRLITPLTKSLGVFFYICR
jgi:hypothetical protein